jgi:LuxR family transcriptional regulator, maltose regulon positive regulatory protein
LARKVDDAPKALRAERIGRGQTRTLASFGPSKIAAPRLADTADNERLFFRLDGARRRPVAWVHGPPGSGKTTLVTSYAAARGLRPLWLRLDEGDSEASTLFFYLGLAEAAARGAADERRLPALTQEYQRGVVAFAHNFFRRLFEGSDPPPLVLDDYHEIAEDSPVHNVLAAGFREIPEAGNVVVLSRAPPPRAFARLRVNGAMEVVTPAELRLTHDEAQSVAFARGALCDKSVIDLAEGWTAGLILVMEAARSGTLSPPSPHSRGEGQDEGLSETRRRGIASPPTPAHSPQAGRGCSVRLASRQLLFDYLSGEVFERMGARAQRNLMRLAFMPTMTTAAAERITGDVGAGELLESLAARNYFTARDAGADPHYRFHPLFRDFLLASAGSSFDAAELANVRRAAAHALAEAGQPEPAATLLAEAGAWDDLTQLILYWAPALEREGRHATIAAWMDRLPPDRVKSDGWLSDWAGEARLPMNPAEARPFLMRALDLFEESGDDVGAYLAWAGATEAILHDFSARQATLDESIERMRELNRRFPDIPSAEIECRVAQAMYLALSRRTNTRKEIALWRRRALAAADAAGTEHIRTILMAFIVVWALHDGDFSLARELLAALSSPEAVGDEHLARTLVASATLFAQMHRQAPGSAVDTADYVLSLENKFGVRAFGAIHANHAAHECVRIGDIKQARAWLSRAANLAESYRPERDASGANFNLAYLGHTAGLVALAEGKIDEAIAKMRAGVDAFAQAGIDYAEAHGRLMLAQALLIGRSPAGAGEQANAAEELLNRSASESLRFPLDLLRAELAIRSGDPVSARAGLTRALAEGRESGGRGSPFLLPTIFSRRSVAVAAEADYPRQLPHRGERRAPGADAQSASPAVRNAQGRFGLRRGER